MFIDICLKPVAIFFKMEFVRFEYLFINVINMLSLKRLHFIIIIFITINTC